MKSYSPFLKINYNISEKNNQHICNKTDNIVNQVINLLFLSLINHFILDNFVNTLRVNIYFTLTHDNILKFERMHEVYRMVLQDAYLL